MVSVSRRAVLTMPALLAAGLVVGGCTDPPPPVAIDPERERLDAALAAESQLLLDAAGWTSGQTLQSQVIAALTVHVERLQQTLGVTPTEVSSPTPSTSLTTAAPLTSAELARRAQRVAITHSRSLRDAAPESAALLASLAASDFAIARALRGSP